MSKKSADNENRDLDKRCFKLRISKSSGEYNVLDDQDQDMDNDDKKVFYYEFNVIRTFITI